MTSTTGTLLTAIAACLCAEVNPDDTMCFCGVIAGEAAVHDFWPDCTNDGMAWVRLGSSYPSTQLGEVDQSPGVRGKFLGLDIEVGIVRTHEMEDDAYITPEEYARMTAQQADDMHAIRKVIACCDALEERDFILGAYRPIGPTGGVYGGLVTVFTQVH